MTIQPFKKLRFALLLLVLISLGQATTALAGKDHFHAESESTKALLSKIWWNQKKKVAEFSLTEEQRHKMDHDFVEYMQHHQEDNNNQKQAFEALGQALTSADLSKAATQRDEVTKMATVNTNRQIDMMIQVVGHLSAEQRALIAEKYPKLMTRLWVRSANPAAMQMGRSEVRRGKKANK